MVFDLNLTQIINSCSTHVKGNILDLVFTNAVELVSDLSVLKDTILTSDHFIISFSVKSVKSLVHHFCSSKSMLDYSKADFIGLCDFLLDYDFGLCYARILRR